MINRDTVHTITTNIEMWRIFMNEHCNERVEESSYREQREKTLQALQTVQKLGERNNLTEQEEQQLQPAMTTLNDLNGKAFLDLVKNLHGNELQNTFACINIYGLLSGGSVDRLSWMGLSLLVNYFLAICNDRVGRCAIGILVSLLGENATNIDQLSRDFGFGKDRIYRAINEIQTGDLVLTDEQPNNPGAGRTPAAETFSQSIMPACIACGIPEKELIMRHEELTMKTASQAALKAITEMDQKKDDSENTENDISPEETTDKDRVIKSFGSYKKMAAVEDVTDIKACQAYQNMQAVSIDLISRIHPVMMRAKFGPTEVLTETKKFILNSLEWMSQLVNILQPACTNKDKTYYTSEFFSASQHNEVSGKMDITPDVRTAACNILYVASIELKGLCEKAIVAWGTMDTDQIPYHSLKRFCRSFRSELRQCIRNMDKWRNGYLAVKKSKAYNTDNAIPSSLGKKGNTPTVKVDLQYIKSRMNEIKLVHNRIAQDITNILIQSQNKSSRTPTLQSALDALSQYYDQCNEAVMKCENCSDKQKLYAVAILIETLWLHLRKWQDIAEKNRTPYEAAVDVSASIVSFPTASNFGRVINEYNLCTKETEKCGVENIKTEENNYSKTSDTDTQIPTSDTEIITHFPVDDTEKTKLEQYVIEIKGKFQILEDVLASCSETGRLKDKDTATIDEARTHLKTEKERFISQSSAVFSNITAQSVHAFNEACVQFQDILDTWIGKTNKTTGRNPLSFSQATILSKTIISKAKKLLPKIWRYYESTAMSETREKHLLIQYADLTENNEVAAYFQGGYRLSLWERHEMILKFWDEGKDPLDITTWIDYIVTTDCNDNFGGPEGNGKFFKRTRKELRHAVIFLTGIEYSTTTLWNVLTKIMGYTGHQCVKMDQLGKKHELRHAQFDYIVEQVKNIDLNTTLILSIDTKAFVVLGRLKHDNGILMCSPDGKIYHVYDHDFPMLMKDIYPNGTNLVDPSRLNERAVLHPVGVLCLNDNTGYVSLVLGKDTAESMCALISNVFKIKKAEKPELKNILLIADGGGANSANGILWTDQLLNLSAETQSNIIVHHLAPGTSRHNQIEHKLWAYISIHWKGKPKLDIEHIMKYISETTTSTGLKVTCFFDPHHYKTNQERKASGEEVLTRAKLNDKAAGRIVHHFSQENDMYRWNYTVYPTARTSTTEIENKKEA